jgi:hypothetical protein
MINYEIGYEHNPDDLGNTVALGSYHGISPVSHPKWNGWKIVKSVLDNMVKPMPFGTREYDNWLRHANKRLAENPGLQRAVRVFYGEAA